MSTDLVRYQKYNNDEIGSMYSYCFPSIVSFHNCFNVLTVSIVFRNCSAHVRAQKISQEKERERRDKLSAGWRGGGRRRNRRFQELLSTSVGVP